MADIFISYKREERDRLRPLVHTLEAHGYTVWWDADVTPGESWTRKIKKELDEAKCVLVVWTRLSVDEDRNYTSEHIEAEAGQGKRRGVLVPVLLDEDRIAWTHEKSHYADLSGWNGGNEHPGLSALLKGVAQHAGSREPPKPGELKDWILAESASSPAALVDFAAAHPDSVFAEIAANKAARAALNELIFSGRLKDEDWLACAEEVLCAVDNILQNEISEMEQLCPPTFSPEEAYDAKTELFELSMVVNWIPWPTAFSDRIDLLRDKINARTVPTIDD